MLHSELTDPPVSQGAFFSKIVSTEFVGFVSTAAVAVVMAFTSLGLIDKAHTEDIAQKVSGMVGACAALATMLAGLVKYGGWRTEIKKEAMRTNVERIVAERSEPATMAITKNTETEAK